MGIPLKLFLEPNSIIDDLICGSCRQVLEEPVMLQPCDHTFCSQCIDNHHNRGTAADDVSVLSCPVDELAITGTRIPPLIYANLLSKLELRCSFNTEGCDEKMKLDATFFEHRQKCEFNPNTPKPCVGDCGAMLVTSERPSHNCVQYLKTENESLKRQLVTSQQEVASCRRASRRPSSNSTEEDTVPPLSKRVSLGQPSTSSDAQIPATSLIQDHLKINKFSLPGHLREKITQIVLEGFPGGITSVGNKVVWPGTKADCLKLAKSLELSLKTNSGLPDCVWSVVVNRMDLPRIMNFYLEFGEPPSVEMAVRDLEIDIYSVRCK